MRACINQMRGRYHANSNSLFDLADRTKAGARVSLIDMRILARQAASSSIQTSDQVVVARDLAAIEGRGIGPGPPCLTGSVIANGTKNGT